MSAIPYNWDPNMARTVATLSQNNQSYMTTGHSWTFTSAVGGHAFGTNPALPAGYNRMQYNEERDLASKGYIGGVSHSIAGTVAGITGSAFLMTAPVEAALEASAVRHAMAGMHGAAQAGGNALVPYGFTAGGSAAASTGGGALVPQGVTAGRHLYNNGLLKGWRGNLLKANYAISDIGSKVFGAIGRTTGGFVGKSAEWGIGKGVSYASNLFKAGKVRQVFIKGGLGLGKAVATGGAAIGGGVGAFVGAMFNPIFLAKAALINEGMTYLGNEADIFSAEHQAEKSMIAKSDRILQFGRADFSRGLSGGMSSAQRGRLLESMRSMAAVSANRNDLFGMGRHSVFGGQNAYAKQLTRISRIFDVGTDMGMFDGSKSTSKVINDLKALTSIIDKLGKVLKKSDAQMTAIVAGLRHQGLSMNEVSGQITRMNFISKVTGQSFDQVNMAANMGSQMGVQRGLGGEFGMQSMNRSQLMFSRAVRSGMLTKKQIYNMGGKEKIITNLTNAQLNFANDAAIQAELAHVLTRDKDGNVVIDQAKLKAGQAASRSAEASREAAVRRELATKDRTYSRMLGKKIEGGELYDAKFDTQEFLSSGGNIAPVIQYMVDQHLTDRGRDKTAKNRELMAIDMINRINPNMSRQHARVLARQVMGGFAEQEDLEKRGVTAERLKRDREAGRHGIWGSMVYTGTRALAYAGSRWQFLTGTPDNLDSITHKWEELGDTLYGRLMGGSPEERGAHYRAAKRHRYGDTGDEVINRVSKKELVEALTLRGDYADPRKKEMIKLDKVMGAFYGGMDTNMTDEEKEIYKQMKSSGYSATSADMKEKGLGVFINDIKGDANSSEYVKIARDIAAGKKVVINEGNARTVGVVKQMMHKLSREFRSKDEEVQTKFKEDLRSYDDVNVIADGITTGDYKAVSDREHQLYRNMYKGKDINNIFKYKTWGQMFLGNNVFGEIKQTLHMNINSIGGNEAKALQGTLMDNDKLKDAIEGYRDMTDNKSANFLRSLSKSNSYLEDGSYGNLSAEDVSDKLNSIVDDHPSLAPIVDAIIHRRGKGTGYKGLTGFLDRIIGIREVKQKTAADQAVATAYKELQYTFGKKAGSVSEGIKKIRGSLEGFINQNSGSIENFREALGQISEKDRGKLIEYGFKKEDVDKIVSEGGNIDFMELKKIRSRTIANIAANNAQRKDKASAPEIPGTEGEGTEGKGSGGTSELAAKSSENILKAAGILEECLRALHLKN